MILTSLFTEAEILEELENRQNDFTQCHATSISRILPNLCYIGGGGELAYWFQLSNILISIHFQYCY
jgi:uncharacterized protein YllA (UPF0747 family)